MTGTLSSNVGSYTFVCKKCKQRKLIQGSGFRDGMRMCAGCKDKYDRKKQENGNA